VRRWLRAGQFPERQVAPRHSSVDRWLSYLEKRWADGCHNRSQLWRELQVQGADFCPGHAAPLVPRPLGSARAPSAQFARPASETTQSSATQRPPAGPRPTTHLHSNKPSRRACAPFLPTSPPLWNWPNSSGACCGNAMRPHGRPGRRRPANLLSITSRSSCNAMRPQCGPRSPCLGARDQ